MVRLSRSDLHEVVSHKKTASQVKTKPWDWNHFVHIFFQSVFFVIASKIKRIGFMKILQKATFFPNSWLRWASIASFLKPPQNFYRIFSVLSSLYVKIPFEILILTFLVQKCKFFWALSNTATIMSDGMSDGWSASVHATNHISKIRTTFITILIN